jgi:hypothetical protein
VSVNTNGPASWGPSSIVDGSLNVVVAGQPRRFFEVVIFVSGKRYVEDLIDRGEVSRAAGVIEAINQK